MAADLEKILIVDDDRLMLFGLSRALMQKSFEVTTAATARQALLGLDCSHLTLCLINLHLPDADGLDLMEEIGRRCPETKIVVMTASFINDLAAREKIKAAMSSGKCLFLAKPFNLADATNLVLKAIAGDPGREWMAITEEGLLDRKRKFQRKPFVSILDIFASIIGEGEVKRNSWRAISTDICDGGIGLLVHFPLNISQVISFGEELSGRTGVVAWSTMLDNKLCRAGVRFT